MNDLSSILFARALLFGALLSFGGLSLAQLMFRVTAIPDEYPTELARKAAPLIKYFETQLGMKVDFTLVTDYAAIVEALVNRKAELARFGGYTFVQAQVRSGVRRSWSPIAKNTRGTFLCSQEVLARLCTTQ